MKAATTKHAEFVAKLEEHEDIRWRDVDWYIYKEKAYCQLVSFRGGFSTKIQVLYVPPEFRRQGLMGELLEILKATCDATNSNMFLVPVPLRFTRPIEKVNLWNVTERDLVDERDFPLDPPPAVDWKTLKAIYERHGFVSEPGYAATYDFHAPQLRLNPNLGQRSLKLRRYPMVYRGKTTE